MTRDEKEAAIAALGTDPSVNPAPGGLLLAHGVTCLECGFGHCALWGFAPMGALPPNAICPACHHKWRLPAELFDALKKSASIPRIAALIDADNIDPHSLGPLHEWFENRGNLLVFRAYGNRNTFNGPVWNQALEAGFDLVVCDVRPQAADMTIAVDLGVLAARREYNEIFVVSGDRALSIAAEHTAAQFGERQLVFCGPPQAVLNHVEQCRLGINHARVEEVVGLLQLMLFERQGRERSDVLHHALLESVPWFHPRLYGRDGFAQFIAEHFMVERATDGGHWVTIPPDHDREQPAATHGQQPHHSHHSRSPHSSGHHKPDATATSRRRNHA